MYRRVNIYAFEFYFQRFLQYVINIRYLLKKYNIYVCFFKHDSSEMKQTSVRLKFNEILISDVYRQGKAIIFTFQRNLEIYKKYYLEIYRYLY